MKNYRILNKQQFSLGNYAIVPIRSKDRYDIMKWRNEQMYHLRQNEPLTREKQDSYFDKVVARLFEEEKPEQLLFSYLEGEKCIGYGGLVHINWIDKNAEISFIMNTELEKEFFEFHWEIILDLLEEVAFKELKLHKIFTYAFDLRPRLYTALKKSGFGLNAELKEHCFFDDRFISVKIHSKINREKEIRDIQVADLYVTYGWANDPNVRKFSFNKNKITLKEHASWFFSTLENSNSEYYMLEVNGNAAGSIRFDIEKDHIAKINYLLDPNFTGKGLGTYLLENGIKFLQKNRTSVQKVYGYVLEKNLASVRIFEKLSFRNVADNPSEFKFEKIIK
ncbi:GNAT family N-acetyltransferase [Salegentibacter sp. JZCK2]|uniref:GNAT family N-acetyltransferase n=1 Tax=Salegentibacter tibetensis TaxID=2873600 RepID=UPI001CCF991F|nr:GNAT family N-acetyltransferase [Salegentibacter tibetensis]MBZ9729075.1 GNAT family N-acetyltransferase [Salegentibacter tibetensis]